MVLVAVLFSLLLPAPLFACPLAALLLMSRLGSRGEAVAAGLATAVTLAWMLLPGSPPDQVLRAGLLFSSITFVMLTRQDRLSFTHRALISMGSATVLIATLFLVTGLSWDELHWWVVFERTHQSSIALTPLRLTNPNLAQSFEEVLGRSVAFEANNFAALTALKLLAGLALATSLYFRLAASPVGSRLGRFRDFRFTEHLGWAAVIPLVIVLLPGLMHFKIAASNLLVLTGTLYVLRGLAVAAFMAGLAGTGPFGVALAVFACFLMLPVVAGVGILLGVLDTGMDLRTRWSKPSAEQ